MGEGERKRERGKNQRKEKRVGSETEGRETVKRVRSLTLTNFSLGTHHSMTIPSPKVQEKNQAQE